MKRVLLLTLVALLVASVAFAQGGVIGLFTDPVSLDCALVDAAPGLLAIYAVHTNIACASAIQFSAPVPSCATGASFLSDTAVFAVSIGNSQSGVAIGYGAQLAGPIHVLTINLFASGTSDACCPWPTAAHSAIPSGLIEMVDCTPGPTGGDIQIVGSVTSIINGNGTCQCNFSPVRETTWGQVKALYSD